MLDSTADSTRSSLELLYHVGRELAAALDLRLVLQRVLSWSINNVGGERGAIVVLNEQREPVDAAIVVGTRIIEHTAQQLRETVDRGLAGWVVRNKTYVLVPDTSRDSRWLRRPDDSQDRSGSKSAICTPLMARERLVGVLTIVHPKPGYFNQDHLSLVQAIADIAGAAVVNAQLYEESQRQARVMTALAESAYILNSSIRLDQVLQRILDQSAQAVQAENVLLGLLDDSKTELVFRAAAGRSAKALLGKHLEVGKGVAGRVARTGRGVVLPSAASNPQAQLPGVDVQALVCAPVRSQGQVSGVLLAINPPVKNLGSEALLVLTGIGSLAGTAINNARLFERLEAAHQRYRELFEGSIDPVVITDLRGMVVESNRQASLATGITPESFKDRLINTLIKMDEPDSGVNFENLSAAESISYESVLSADGGKSIPIEVHVQRIHIDGEDYLQWIFKDVSERKNMEMLQDDLISMVYHDLRSPLANVISSLDLLQTMLPEGIDGDSEAVLTIASNSTDRMQRLVNSLLDIRQLEAGQAITTRERYSPESLVKEAVDAARFIARGKNQEIVLTIAKGIPEVYVDPEMIRRVLINLIENACKFSPSDGKIEVGASQLDAWVQMWVKDSGPGIPPSDQDRIFDKFTRLRAAGSPKGMGLGLAFCKLAVNAHNGRIWLVSQPQAGSQFFFTLPVAGEVE